jgi:hypothetical protein
LVLLVIAAAISVAAWATASYVVDSTSQPARPNGPTRAPVLRSLTPQERPYVTAITSLSPAQLRAAFGTERVSGVDSTLASLTPKERRYVRAIASMGYAQLAAAFGTRK